MHRNETLGKIYPFLVDSLCKDKLIHKTISSCSERYRQPTIDQDNGSALQDVGNLS